MTPPQIQKPPPFPGSVVRKIREHRLEGMPLGRHIHHDPRSLAYQVKPRAALAVTTSWRRVTPVLDQGNLGSCVGNATVGVLGTDPFYATLKPRIDVSLLTLNEAEALSIYSAATTLDSYPGAYPPKDTGSDGLAGAKAAQAANLISGYLHCTSIDAVITALQTGPVITGVNWYDSFDQPDSSGRIQISPNASVRGGHEFEINGVDLEAKTFAAVQSWGPDWGAAGTFSFSFDTYARLLAEDGDATKFVPITQPPPTPKPITPNTADAALAATVGVACARSRPFRMWKAALGL